MPAWVVVLEVAAVLCLVGYMVRCVLESAHWPLPTVHPYACEHCPRRYKSSSILALHLRAQHHELQGPIKARMDAMKPRRRKTGRAKLRLV